MLTGKKIPFINENSNMSSALKFISRKKLGVLVARNSKKKTTGIITDGQIRRTSEKKGDLKQLKVRDVMTKNPISVESNVLAAKALSLMNSKRITFLCVHREKYKNKTIGVIHIHNILESNIQWQKNLYSIFFNNYLFYYFTRTFFKYFKKSNLSSNLVTSFEKPLANESLIEDLKYSSTDKEGNEYKIEAKKGNIDKNDPDILYLENVDALISLNNSEFISISSKFAKYNTKNYDTLFNNSVSVDYGEHFLKSEFLDLSFEKNLVSIYDNVRYVGGISSLSADRAEIDILSKKTKIFMENSNKKVQINSKSKDGNN